MDEKIIFVIIVIFIIIGIYITIVIKPKPEEKVVYVEEESPSTTPSSITLSTTPTKTPSTTPTKTPSTTPTKTPSITLLTTSSTTPSTTPTKTPSTIIPSITVPKKSSTGIDISFCSNFEGFCNDPSKYITNCIEYSDLDIIKDYLENCAYKGSVTKDNYDKSALLVDNFSKGQIKLLPYPRVPCMGIKTCGEWFTQFQDCNIVGDYDPNVYSKLITECALNKEINKEEYDNIRKYFKDNFNVAMQEELPPFPCKNISYEQTCSDPYAVFKTCSSVRAPLPDVEMLDVIRSCHPNIPNDKYEKFRKYYKDKSGVDIGEQPDVLCKISPSAGDMCLNPASYIKYCKKNNMSQQEYDIIKNCARNDRISDDMYNKLKAYTSQNNLQSFPDNDIIRAKCATTDFCEDPIPKINYCKPDLRTTTEQEDLQQIRYCISKNKLPNEKYNEVKQYFESKGLTVPEQISIDCGKCSVPSFMCQNLPECYKCDTLSPSGNVNESSLKFGSEDCVINNFEQVSKGWGYLKDKFPQYFTEQKYKTAYDKAIEEGKFIPPPPNIYYMPSPPSMKISLTMSKNNSYMNYA
jgi:hypothetical protein